MSAVAEELSSIVEIDGLPYVTIDWLERRIYRAEVCMKRWNQEARRMVNRTDREGQALYHAYLWHSLQASYRADRWKRCLTITRKAIVERQMNARISFGRLINSRRIAAGMTMRELARLAGISDKTIGNIEKADFPPSRHTLESIIAVGDLRLSWDDVSPFLLDDNPEDGRKNKPRKSGISRIAKAKIVNYFLAETPTG